VYTLFSQKARWKDVSVGGKITSNWLLKNKVHGCGLETSTAGSGQMTGCWTI